MYSKAAQERLHESGRDMSFGGVFVMRPEAAERLSFGLVERVITDDGTVMYRRRQVCAVEERLLITQARARQDAEARADRGDQPAPWSSGRTPYPGRKTVKR
jgi:hypothetical protein